MNSRHSPAFCKFFACALTFLALCAGAPAQAANAFDNASIEITWVYNDTDGGKHCYNFLVGFKITGVTPGFVYHQNAVRVQQGSVINDVFVDDSINGSIFPDPADGWMEFYGYKNAASQAICDVLEDKPFTVSVRACATPDRNPANCVWIESAPVVVNRWRGPTSELTSAPVGTATPTSATISASGNACTDASLHIVLEGLTPDSGYIFSALDVALTQGSSTGTLQRAGWMVTADGAGRYEGDVPLSSFSPASGITCADLAAGTPFDVKLTATLPGGAAVDGTTQYAFPPYTITVDKVAGGTVTCDPTVPTYGGSADCRVTPDAAAGYTFDRLDIVDDPAGTATLGTCSTGTPITCPISNVTGNVTVKGVFKQAQPQPQQPRVISDTPTMSDVGLLLSGLALAGAAVPALRRREKQGKKADTSR